MNPPLPSPEDLILLIHMRWMFLTAMLISEIQDSHYEPQRRSKRLSMSTSTAGTRFLLILLTFSRCQNATSPGELTHHLKHSIAVFGIEHDSILICSCHANRISIFVISPGYGHLTAKSNVVSPFTSTQCPCSTSRDSGISSVSEEAEALSVFCSVGPSVFGSVVESSAFPHRDPHPLSAKSINSTITLISVTATLLFRQLLKTLVQFCQFLSAFGGALCFQDAVDFLILFPLKQITYRKAGPSVNLVV